MYDVVIIGSGVIGLACASFISQYALKTLVVEKEEDICSGTSKANSAIVHGGFDAKSGTLKAKFNVLGSKMMKELAEKLNFAYNQNGALVLCFNKEDEDSLYELYQRGLTNGVKNLEIISGEKVRELEPNISKKVVSALYCKDSAIICPFELCEALSEHAYNNGVSFKFDYKVEKINKIDDHYLINDEINTKIIINCAGVYSDEIHNMVSDTKYHITPRKGDYLLLDKTMGSYTKRTLFTLPTKKGKGVLITPTVHGNLLVGPTARDIDDKEGTYTSLNELDEVKQKACITCPDLKFDQVITSFSGLRAHEDNGDFIIQESEDNFFDCVGIESPGLSASLAIGEYISDLLAKKLNPELNKNYRDTRKGHPHLNSLSYEQRNDLIKENPDYGQIICRCEGISKGEIIDALRIMPNARSLDGVKRRTRAQMGRCQGGFCSNKIMEIMSKELHLETKDINKNKKGSYMVMGTLKDKYE